MRNIDFFIIEAMIA